MSADEAIYSAWALAAYHGDPWFLATWPDKPPLYLWTLGAAFQTLGNRPETAQFLNIGFTTLTIAVTAVTARVLWGAAAGLTAAALLALNPFALSFAPTAFTDPMLVLTGMLALAAAVRGRALWAGLWLGAAVMTKQQGLLYVPLIVGALWLGPRAQATGHRWTRALGGLLLVVVPVMLWDSLRWRVAPSPWDLSVRNYGPIAPAAPVAWPDRWRLWQDLLYYLQADAVPWIVGGLVLACAGVVAWRTRPARPVGMALWLGVWAAAFIAFHVMTTIQPWDRYLLPLAPILALLLGWSVAVLGRVSPRGAAVAALLLVLTLVRPATVAAGGGLPVGGDKGAYTGLPAALAWIDAHVDAPYVLYHSRLGWHYRYYRFADSATGRADLRWFPSTTYLADNAEKTPHRPQFYVEPTWAVQADLAQRLAMRGLTLAERGRFGRFTLYEIGRATATDPGKAAPCSWCVSRTPGDEHLVAGPRDRSWPRFPTVADGAVTRGAATGVTDGVTAGGN